MYKINRGLALGALLLLVGSFSLADEPGDPEPTVPLDTTEVGTPNHAKLAKSEVFEKMATCLKSNKSEEECGQQLKNNCHKMGGMKHCGMGPMMAGMKHGKAMSNKGKSMGRGMGMGKGGMMNDMEGDEMPSTPDKGMQGGGMGH
jgi:hypothetical protein